MASVVESPGIINKLNLVHDLLSHLQSRRKDECPCASEAWVVQGELWHCLGKVINPWLDVVGVLTCLIL
jgi:hypothetical protein